MRCESGKNRIQGVPKAFGIRMDSPPERKKGKSVPPHLPVIVLSCETHVHPNQVPGSVG